MQHFFRFTWKAVLFQFASWKQLLLSETCSSLKSLLLYLYFYGTESHFCRKCWRWVILAWALFYLWEAKMLKTEENNWKESKWKLVLIYSLNVLQPRICPFSGCGDNTVCHQKSVAPLCVMFPYRGCAWEPLRPSLCSDPVDGCLLQQVLASMRW